MWIEQSGTVETRVYTPTARPVLSALLTLAKLTLRRIARDVHLPRWRDKLDLRPAPLVPIRVIDYGFFRF